MQSSKRKRVSSSLIIAACLSTFLLCGSLLLPLPCQAASGQTVIIQIVGSTHTPGFWPQMTTVHVNDTVLFVNQAFPAVTYLISADDGSFTSQSLFPGSRWSMKFSATGTHIYRDHSYPQSMIGEIVVVDPSVALLPTPAPAVEATMIALIKAGQSPPDNLAVLPRTSGQKPKPVPKPNSFNFLFLMIVILIVLACTLSGVAIYQIRKQKRAEIDPLEEANEDFGLANYLALSKRAFQRVRQETSTKIASIVQRVRQRLSRDEDEDDMDEEESFATADSMEDTLV